MVMKEIDAGMMQKAFLAAAKGLEAKKEWINELNVFPVPDGDTGTNMTLTIMSAAREVAAIEEPTIENLSKAISSGSLRGARGNSGVILSQLFRGFLHCDSQLSAFLTDPLSSRFSVIRIFFHCFPPSDIPCSGVKSLLSGPLFAFRYCFPALFSGNKQ